MPRVPAKQAAPATQVIPAKHVIPARHVVNDAGNLLARIMDTPHLAHIVPRLHAEVLHRLILRCGLEDCGEIVALATPEQLTGVFDRDLWRGSQPGADEQFDADRFGVWLEVLAESGADEAARKVAAMDVDLVIAALAQHMLVVDPASASNGEDDLPVSILDDRFVRELGGYRVAPTRLDSWDAIDAVLLALDADHAEFFHRVMRGCRRLSNSAPEIDGLDDLMADREQGMFDLALERERRREQQGFATPAQARAFLQMSRQIDLDHDTAPSGNPIATAYFREMDTPDTGRSSRSDEQLSSNVPLAPDDSDSAFTASATDIIDVLVEAGVLPQPTRALLEGATDRTSRFALMRTHMQHVGERHDSVHSTRHQELAYLANTLLAGCAVQGRSLTVQEASEAAVAVCNLGLENWPSKWRTGNALPGHFLVEHDLVRVFQVGWRVLYTDVCMYAAERVVDVVARLRIDDNHLQSDLDRLRVEMDAVIRGGAPWRAHPHLDVVAILDSPTWAALFGLTNECPVMHAAIDSSRMRKTLSINPSSFDFISENSQIASIHEFLSSLRRRLRG
jgi:Family of unknown function (DUF6178)